MEKTHKSDEEILDELLIFRGEHPNNVRHWLFIKERQLAKDYAEQEVAKYKAVIEKLLPLAKSGSAYYRQNAGFDWVAEKDKSKIIIYRAKKLIEK